MENRNLVFYANSGAVFHVSDEASMSRMLTEVPGVARASKPVDFLIKNVGWGVSERISLSNVTLRFDERTVSGTVIAKMRQALAALESKRNLNVTIFQDRRSPQLGTTMSVKRARSHLLDFLTEDMAQRARV